MLIIGQPHKMLTDLIHIKGSTELSAMSAWILVSGGNHKVSNLVSSFCVTVHGQSRRYSNVTASLLP
jgi:hypothetical protein